MSSVVAFVPPTRSRSRGPSGSRSLVVVLVAAAIALSACQPAPASVARPGRGSLWISRAELARLPQSGPAWSNLVKVAHSDWGTPSLSDNNANHDTSTLAGALVGTRTNDAAMIAKTRAAIMSVTRVTAYQRVLEMSRNITSYVIAADIVGLPPRDDAVFTAFLGALPRKPLQGHSGARNMLETALYSGTNWGSMSRAAVTAIDLYVGDRIQLGRVVNAYRAWLGEAVPNEMRWSDTGWHVPGRAKVGIEPRGARLYGRNIDGVQPEDQRRTGEPGSGAAPKGSYPWESLQGGLVTGVLLQRAGMVNIHAGDDALVRAFAWLYGTNGNPAGNDDRWQPWLLNSVAGTHFATVPATGAGKNMAWSDWTNPA